MRDLYIHFCMFRKCQPLLFQRVVTYMTAQPEVVANTRDWTVSWFQFITTFYHVLAITIIIVSLDVQVSLCWQWVWPSELGKLMFYDANFYPILHFERMLKCPYNGCGLLLNVSALQWNRLSSHFAIFWFSNPVLNSVACRPVRAEIPTPTPW